MSRNMKQDIKSDCKQATKQKIALALRQLMQERPLRKITVQDLMERTQMTRQSFYYHFQDIQDVLAWIGEQQVSGWLQDTQELSFEDWMMRIIVLLNEDRNFYRQMLHFGDQAFLHRFGNKLLRQRMLRLFFGTETEEKLNDHQRFVVDFAVWSVLSYLSTYLSSRRTLDLREVRARLRCLMDTLSLHDAEKG